MKRTQARKLYCFRPGPHVYYKYPRHKHLRCPMMEEASLETQPYNIFVLIISISKSLGINQRKHIPGIFFIGYDSKKLSLGF